MTDNIIQFPKKLNGSKPDPEPMEIEVLVFSCGHTAGHLQWQASELRAGVGGRVARQQAYHARIHLPTMTIGQIDAKLCAAWIRVAG